MKPKKPAAPPTEPTAYSPPSAPTTSTALSTAPTYAALPSPTIFLYRAPVQQFLTDCAAGTLSICSSAATGARAGTSWPIVLSKLFELARTAVSKDSLLGFGDRHDLAWRRYGAYGFELDDSMATMAARIELLRAGKAKCRLVAGFCWPWSNPIGSALPRDLRHPSFGGWEGAWIERSEQHLKPLENRYYRWANDESCAEQVGSIYSVQGFEFDHVGVIWGEDLVVRGGKWVADLSKSYDKKFKADLKKSGEDPVEKLRSVYRVLLTRGMQGTSVFVVDPETREWVRGAVASVPTACVV